MIRVRMAFSQSSDGQFLVTSEVLPPLRSCSASVFVTTAFEDENIFLENVTLAGLHDELTVQLVSAVLLTIAERSSNRCWMPLTLTREMCVALGLHGLIGEDDGLNVIRELDLHDVMNQTPAAFLVMEGPRHRVSFLNEAYLKILQRNDASEVLGKTIRDVLPDLQEQRFFAMLDQVYRSGKPYVGHGEVGTMRDHVTGEMTQRYFDYVYFPLKNGEGKIFGIMAQASDVTQKVLAEQVNEAREEQLYKQWAELDAIYRNSPLAMCLLDAKDYRILRINDLKAEILGGSAEELIGKSLPDLVPKFTTLRNLYARVAGGEAIHNLEIRTELPIGSGIFRTFLVTCSPLFEDSGKVGAIASIGMELVAKKEAPLDNKVEPLGTAASAP